MQTFNSILYCLIFFFKDLMTFEVMSKHNLKERWKLQYLHTKTNEKLSFQCAKYVKFVRTNEQLELEIISQGKIGPSQFANLYAVFQLFLLSLHVSSFKIQHMWTQICWKFCEGEKVVNIVGTFPLLMWSKQRSSAVCD